VLILGDAQERLIDALLTVATSERGIEGREPCDLAEIAAAVIQGRQSDVQSHQLLVDSRQGAAAVDGDPQLLQILIVNLIDDAFRHNTNGGPIEVTSATIDGWPT
jgi:signal transduction histidine kinase